MPSARVSTVAVRSACWDQSRWVRTAPSLRTWRIASGATSACTQPARVDLADRDDAVLGEAEVGRPVDRRRARAAGGGGQPVGIADRRRVHDHALALQRAGLRRRAAPASSRAASRWRSAPRGARRRPRPSPARAAGTRRRSRSGCRSGRARSRRPAAPPPARAPVLALEAAGHQLVLVRRGCRRARRAAPGSPSCRPRGGSGRKRRRRAP